MNQGSVYFWKYKTDGWIGSEWHFRADKTGKDFVIRLLKTIMLSDHPMRHVLKIKPVTRTIAALPCFYLPAENRSALILNFKPGESFAREWTIRDNEQTVDVSFGKAVATEWLETLSSSSKEPGKPIGIGEDDVIFVW